MVTDRLLSILLDCRLGLEGYRLGPGGSVGVPYECSFLRQPASCRVCEYIQCAKYSMPETPNHVQGTLPCLYQSATRPPRVFLWRSCEAFLLADDLQLVSPQSHHCCSNATASNRNLVLS